MDEENKRFGNASDLKTWLQGRGLDEDDADEAAEKLFTRKFNKTSKLFGISSEQLNAEGLPTHIAVELSNKLKQQTSDHTPINKVHPRPDTDGKGNCLLIRGLVFDRLFW